MDKHFFRIVMLSVLLPAGVALANAIEHDRAPLPATEQNFISRLTYAPVADSALEQISEGRRFAEAVSIERNAASRREDR